MKCNKCGAESAGSFCEYCGAPLEQAAPEVAQTFDAPVAPKENMVLGIVGALAGAAIGAAVMILLSQIGIFAAIGGFVLSFCCLKGYELLGKGLSIPSIIICVVIMLVTPFLADSLDWGIVIMNDFASYDYEVPLVDCILLIPTYLEEGYIEMESYITNLLLLYGFTALGAFSQVSEALKKAKH